MTNVELLNDYIQKSGLKKCYLAKKIGVSHTTFAALLKNKAEFKASQISALCEVLNIHDEEIICAIFFARNGALKATGAAPLNT